MSFPEGGLFHQWPVNICCLCGGKALVNINMVEMRGSLKQILISVKPSPLLPHLLSLLLLSVMSNSLWAPGLQPARLLCPWDFPGKNTGVGCYSLLQGIFLTQGSNPCPLHLLLQQADSLPLSHIACCFPSFSSFSHLLLFLGHTRHTPASETLHILFMLPRSFPFSYSMASFLLLGLSSNILSSVRPSLVICYSHNCILNCIHPATHSPASSPLPIFDCLL